MIDAAAGGAVFALDVEHVVEFFFQSLAEFARIGAARLRPLHARTRRAQWFGIFLATVARRIEIDQDRSLAFAQRAIGHRSSSPAERDTVCTKRLGGALAVLRLPTAIRTRHRVGALG